MKWKRAVRKEYMLYDSIYLNSRTCALLWSGGKWVSVSQGWWVRWNGEETHAILIVMMTLRVCVYVKTADPVNFKYV